MIHTIYINRLVEIWIRDTYNVDADSEEEILKKLKGEFESPEYNEEEGFIETETLYETEMEILPKHNNYNFTKELILVSDSKQRQLKININNKT